MRIGRAISINPQRGSHGRREILGIDVGEAEIEAFGPFLRSLLARGLAGVHSSSQTPMRG